MQVPAPFEYRRAESVDDAIALLEKLGDGARLVAGGHSLLPMMKLRLTSFDYLIDINELHDDLGYITVDGDMVRVGAMTRHRELAESAELATHFPIIREAEAVIADPIVRNRGTIGGSLCQADPAEDLSAVCVALGATCVVRGPGGTREITMADFHVGPYETTLTPTEILTEVRFPIRPGGGSAYAKVERRAGDWAIGAVGAAVWLDGTVISDATVALVAVGAESPSVPGMADLLRGNAPSAELFAAAGQLATDNCDPIDDLRGSTAYKKHLAGVLTQRVLTAAADRAAFAGIAQEMEG